MYSASEAALMVWGKIRRAWLIAFRKKRTVEKLSRRQGACTRCGACCKILFRCPAYDDSGGEPKCLIYNDRPGVCGLFPLDEKDLRERDIVSPGTKCGYFFEEAGKPPDPARIRWGPPEGGGGRRKIGTAEILKSFFRRPARKAKP